MNIPLDIRTEYNSVPGNAKSEAQRLFVKEVSICCYQVSGKIPKLFIRVINLEVACFSIVLQNYLDRSFTAITYLQERTFHEFSLNL